MIVFGRFLRILLSCHVKPNTDPYSVIQDSTLDTPQGGVLEKFLSLPSEGGGEGAGGLSPEGVKSAFAHCVCLRNLTGNYFYVLFIFILEYLWYRRRINVSL